MSLLISNDNSDAISSWESEGGRLAAPVSLLSRANPVRSSSKRKPGRFDKLRNDNGLSIIQIGMREFECIGASPPHDHPHVYLNMGLSNAMLCPYCATAFRFDAALAPDGVEPTDCLYRQP